MLELKQRGQKHLRTNRGVRRTSWHAGCAIHVVVVAVLGSVAANGTHKPRFEPERAGGTDAMNLITRIRKLLRKNNDSGQDLLEYALLVALIALVAVGAITLTGTKASDIFTKISGKLVAP
jgi:Flp pilus assembly pilin Flp